MLLIPDAFRTNFCSACKQSNRSLQIIYKTAAEQVLDYVVHDTFFLKRTNQQYTNKYPLLFMLWD